MTKRDKALAKAAELERLPQSDLRDDLAAALNRPVNGTFETGLRAAMTAAGNGVLADQERAWDARQGRTEWGAEGAMQREAESAEEDAAADWLDDAAGVEALYCEKVAA